MNYRTSRIVILSLLAISMMTSFIGCESALKEKKEDEPGLSTQLYVLGFSGEDDDATYYHAGVTKTKKAMQQQIRFIHLP